MCYQYSSSSDIANFHCPMCKVFKPSAARCPHVRDICYNRANHPRLDVVHLKNAEVKSFNGCGYCKWTRSNPKLPVHNNQGWPGCCRPPTASEQRLIQAAEWPTVSIVHSVPIPPEIKSILDNLVSRGNPLPGMTTASRSPGSQATMPSLDRRNSGNSPTNKSSPTSAKSQPVSIPVRGRSGGSPVQQSSALTGTTPRASAPLSSYGTTIPADQSPLSRRQTYAEGTREKSRTPSARRATDLEGSLSRRNGGGRPSLSNIAPLYGSSKGSSDSPHSLPYPPVPHSSPMDSYTTTSQEAPFGRTLSSKRSTLESAMAALEVNSSSGSSSDSGSSRGSMSDATVISDGAFTDYLSDESEAELQRQAEAKAALVAQNQAEELEFKAARQQLAGVGLRPPKAWDDTNESMLRSTSHASMYTHHSAYNSAPYASAAVAHPARG
ncbi:hypothetical protein PAXINDRAFT_166282 [Paxillus involutus ATCC 200175]|nr:hypothetical protein PAXINDRAFT_166282 [Paxillus involutus ATCC 200175]